jgi:DNA polymerase III delta prime subunit
MTNLLKNKNVAAIINDADGSVYCEITHDGAVSGYFYNGTLYSLNASGRSAPYENLTPLVMYTLHQDNGNYAEFQAAFAEVRDAYKKDSDVTAELLAFASDCFYYETKATLPKTIPESPLDPAMLKQIQQNIDTRNMRSADDKCEVGKTFSHVNFNKAREKSPELKNKEIVNTFFDDCKSAKYELGWEWSAEQQTRIPAFSFLDTYIPNPTHKKLSLVAYNRLNTVIERLDAGKSGKDAIGNEYMNTILVGRPGTGKTTAAMALSATLGLPIYTVPLSKYTEEDEFQGKTKVAEGGFKFFPTAFLEAYKNGGIVVLEEFNLADPAVMQGGIGQAIEAPFLLMEDGCTEVCRHPLCVIVMTMNTATQGSREPNEAFTSRAPLVLTMDDPEADEFINILASKGYDKKISQKVFSAYTKVIEFLRNESAGEDIMLSLTMRHCLEALYLISKVGFDFKEAIHDTMAGSLAIKDLELAKRVYESVIETMPDA